MKFEDRDECENLYCKVSSTYWSLLQRKEIKISPWLKHKRAFFSPGSGRVFRDLHSLPVNPCGAVQVLCHRCDFQKQHDGTSVVLKTKREARNPVAWSLAWLCYQFLIPRLIATLEPLVSKPWFLCACSKVDPYVNCASWGFQSWKYALGCFNVSSKLGHSFLKRRLGKKQTPLLWPHWAKFWQMGGWEVQAYMLETGINVCKIPLTRTRTAPVKSHASLQTLWPIYFL